MKKKMVLPYNLQFFAEPDSAGGDTGEGVTSGDDQEGAGKGEKGKEDQEELVFTQSQVTAMMAREKKQGRSSVLKNLGFKTEKEAQDAVKLLNALLDSQKTEGEKAEEEKGRIDEEKKEAESRAAIAEAKLALFTEGVDKDFIDDVVAIVNSKVTEDKDFVAVVKEMKKDKKYASFFKNGGAGPDGGQPEGTGSPLGSFTGGGSGGSGKNYGQMLAERRLAGQGQKKSSYF